MPAYPGRRREFTYAKRRELLDHIGQGATVEEAAQIGISLRTVQREARHNEFFDHDLQLALHAAPVDPHKLVARAARTHWRAAAWLLERTDPDRFAKRPPNSCRPETLREMSDWLIETALEATSPEQREAVFRRMRTVADKALDVLMPDQHDVRRALVGELPHRPMPLSDHEFAKTLRDEYANSVRVVDDRPPSAVGVPSNAAGRLPAAPAGRLTAAPPAGGLRAQTPAASPEAALSTTPPEAASVADPVAFYRAQPPRKPPAGRPSERIADFRLLDSDMMDAEWRYPLPDEDDAEAEDASSTAPNVGGVSDADSRRHQPLGNDSIDRGRRPLPQHGGRVSYDPPNGGIMSPKMSAATPRTYVRAPIKPRDPTAQKATDRRRARTISAASAKVIVPGSGTSPIAAASAPGPFAAS